MFKTVLFPIDRSRESQEAAQKVVELVKTFDSRLILLSVVEKPVEGPESAPAEPMMSPDAVAELLKGAQNALAQQGIEAETIEREGQPPFVICDVADEIAADVIVMGCGGMGLTEEGAAESVTNRVINLSPCPVLIFP